MNNKEGLKMQYDTLTPLITRLNDFLDSLIKDFKEYKLDEETIIFLSEKTRNFINFTELSLFNVVLKVLGSMDDAKYVFDEEVKIINKIVVKIFDKLNEALGNILVEEEGEEHVHDHDHDHEHKHYHIDIENVQKDIDKIIEYLTFLKNVLSDLGKFIISLLRYQNKEITEEDFNKEYTLFKERINSYNNEFEDL